MRCFPTAFLFVMSICSNLELSNKSLDLLVNAVRKPASEVGTLSWQMERIGYFLNQAMSKAGINGRIFNSLRVYSCWMRRKLLFTHPT